MKRNSILVITGILLTAGLLALFYLLFIPKTAYAKVDEVYNSFPLKAELEKKLQSTQKAREKILDSLKTDLKLLSMKVESDKGKNAADVNLFYLKREKLAEKENQFNQDAEAQMEDYKSQIWKQLSQYIKDYGKEYGYDYIFGVNDPYQLLFYQDKYDVTEDMKKYVNEKYEGNRK